MQTTPSSILVVDDTPANLHVLDDALTLAGYSVRPARDGALALRAAAALPPDLILLDIRMPAMDGFEVCRVLKAAPATADVPVIFISALESTADKVQAFRAGGVDYITKPFQMEEVLARVRTHLALRQSTRQVRLHEEALAQANEQLEARVAQRTEQLAFSQWEVLWRLGKAGELRDEDTGNHVVRVAMCSRLLAQQLALSAEQCERLFLTSPLHDVGKIGIPDAILLKPGRLTDDERLTMQQHCQSGAAILRDRSPGMEAFLQITDRQDQAHEVNPLLELAAVIALAHHEHWDGQGYPRGLAREAIPLEGRIVALADVYDALSSPRPYKPAFEESRVVEILAEGDGSHFDPAVHAAFTRCRDEMRSIWVEYTEVRPAAAAVPLAGPGGQLRSTK